MGINEIIITKEPSGRCRCKTCSNIIKENQIELISPSFKNHLNYAKISSSFKNHLNYSKYCPDCFINGMIEILLEINIDFDVKHFKEIRSKLLKEKILGGLN